MTTRDIEAHLREAYGVNASRELISNITDVVVDEIKAWQSRPLDEVYPILYVGGIRIRVKDNGVVTTKTAYLAIGVDVDGRGEVLAESPGGPAESWCQGCPCRVLRRHQRVPGCQRGLLPGRNPPARARDRPERSAGARLPAQRDRTDTR